MIRKIIRPENDNLIIKIPREYIGQEIEYIVFPVKSNEDMIEKSNIGSLGGALKKYANPDKIELEKDAWELHVVDKFSKW